MSLPFEKSDSNPQHKFVIENASVVAKQPVEAIDFDIAGMLATADAPGHWFGPPAACKSWLALGACDAIVRGVPFRRLETRKRDSALYLNLDAGATTFRNRIRAISDAPGLSFASISPSEYSHEILRSLLGQFRGAFVVIDCLSSIYNPNTRSDPAFAMREFVDGLRALYAEHGCGGVIIDHPHRPKERGEPGDYHGSIQKEAAFRSMAAITAEPIGEDTSLRRVRITCRKMSEGAPFAPIDVEIEFGRRVTIRRLAVVDVTNRESIIEAKILDWAQRQTTAFTRRTVAEKVRGQAATATRKAFDELVSTGEIIPTGQKRGNGELFRRADASGSRVPTHSDPPDSLLSGVVSEGGSGPLSLIGDPPSQTHSQTHSELAKLAEPLLRGVPGENDRAPE